MIVVHDVEATSACHQRVLGLRTTPAQGPA
jgi:hypothetical protein